MVVVALGWLGRSFRTVGRECLGGQVEALARRGRSMGGRTGPKSYDYARKVITRDLTSESGQSRSELHWGGLMTPKKKSPYSDIYSKYVHFKGKSVF